MAVFGPSWYSGGRGMSNCKNISYRKELWFGELLSQVAPDTFMNKTSHHRCYQVTQYVPVIHDPRLRVSSKTERL